MNEWNKHLLWNENKSINWNSMTKRNVYKCLYCFIVFIRNTGKYVHQSRTFNPMCLFVKVVFRNPSSSATREPLTAQICVSFESFPTTSEWLLQLRMMMTVSLCIVLLINELVCFVDFLCIFVPFLDSTGPAEHDIHEFDIFFSRSSSAVPSRMK